MRNLPLILTLATSLLPLTWVQAAPADLPVTGQITCSDTAGAVIACAGTGQDGEHQAGAPWPTPHFTVDGTGNCVIDNVTGLLWVRSPEAITRTWLQALDFANDLELCGYTDWRMPNVNELESLVNSEAADPAAFLNGEGFSGIQAGAYWSSTSYTNGSAGLAWSVNMNRGDVSFIPKAGNNYLWSVAGQ